MAAIATLRDARTHQVRGRRMRRGKSRRAALGISASKKALVFCKAGDPYKWQFYGEINPCRLFLSISIACKVWASQPSSNIITCARRRRRLFNLLATREPEQQLKRLLALLLNYLFVHFRHAFLSNAAENGILLSFSLSSRHFSLRCCEWLCVLQLSPREMKIEDRALNFTLAPILTWILHFAAEAIAS
jgi:hypothetical protein